MFPSSQRSQFKNFPCPFYPDCQRGELEVNKTDSIHDKGSESSPLIFADCLYSHSLAKTNLDSQRVKALSSLTAGKVYSESGLTRSTKEEDNGDKKLKSINTKIATTDIKANILPSPLQPLLPLIKAPRLEDSPSFANSTTYLRSTPGPFNSFKAIIPSHSPLINLDSLTVESPPPFLRSDINSKIKMTIRRVVLSKLFVEFQRIYVNILKGSISGLAHSHALR